VNTVKLFEKEANVLPNLRHLHNIPRVRFVNAGSALAYSQRGSQVQVKQALGQGQREQDIL